MESKSWLKVLSGIAKTKGGWLISKRYINNHSNLTWRCSEGHTWDAKPSAIKPSKNRKGTWCPICAGKNKDYLIIKRNLDRVSKRNGGKCLSKIIKNMSEKVQFECKEKHKWLASPKNVLGNKGKQGTWCPRCAKLGGGKTQRMDITDCQKLAKVNGGECLSKTYKNAHTPMIWRCSEGHVWHSKFVNIKYDDCWCPKCSGRMSEGDNLAELNKLAIDRGGKLLSVQYKKSISKLRWQCSNGHVFSLSAHKAKQGGWCQKCSVVYYGEEIVRLIFENVFRTDFPRSYPSWLKFKGQQLELDGFSESLKLGFEHHGVQHYRKIDRFHKSTKMFEAQRARDRAKLRICRKNDVRLIVVPQVPQILSFEKLPIYLAHKLKKAGVKYKKALLFSHHDVNQIYIAKGLDTLIEIARKNGGSCLSKVYFGEIVKLDFQCGNGHLWSATPRSIRGSIRRRGTWCPYCNGNKRNYGEQFLKLKEHVNSLGGKCLFTDFSTLNDKVEFVCKNKHKWLSTPARVLGSNKKKGTWCRECSFEKSGETQRLSIRECDKYARKYKGKCLDRKYKNARVKMRWKCEYGHVFEKALSQIKIGRWCPKCK